MTYADNYNIRTTSVKFNDVGDALDGLITRNYAGLTTGTTTAYIATPSPSWDAYTTSGLVVIIPHVTNTGASTINISGLGLRDLRIGNLAIAAGVLQQSIPTIMAYTGTYFEILLQNVSIPIGAIYTYAGASAPGGYLLCDGATHSTTGAYAALHGVIGYTFGGSGGTFLLPDFRRRMPIGKGASDTLGFTEGGNNTGTAYASRTTSHTHTTPAHYHGMGAGATLNIGSSGTHTISISHDHGVFNSGAGSSHFHTMVHSHADSTSGPGSAHGHEISASTFGPSGTTAGTRIPNTNITTGANTNTTAITTVSESAHTHTTSVQTFYGDTGSESAHTHSIDVPNFAGNSSSDGAHTHAAGNFSGAIGLVTGGVDGNSAMTSGTSNSPFLFINYIIKT